MVRVHVRDDIRTGGAALLLENQGGDPGAGGNRVHDEAAADPDPLLWADLGRLLVHEHAVQVVRDQVLPLGLDESVHRLRTGVSGAGFDVAGLPPGVRPGRDHRVRVLFERVRVLLRAEPVPQMDRLAAAGAVLSVGSVFEGVEEAVGVRGGGQLDAGDSAGMIH